MSDVGEGGLPRVAGPSLRDLLGDGGEPAPVVVQNRAVVGPRPPSNEQGAVGEAARRMKEAEQREYQALREKLNEEPKREEWMTGWLLLCA